MLTEQAFHCPYCDAPISVVLDLSAGDQTYIEDCEVCCQPIQLTYGVIGDTLNTFKAERLDD